jgi:hypothetical protein
MKIKNPINLVVYAVIALILIFFVTFLIDIHGKGNDVRPAPEYPDSTINTNTTDSDPIIGNWVRPNESTVQRDNITFGSYGYVTKWGKNNDNLTFVSGPWTKVSENSYIIQWKGETEMFENYGVVRSFIPTNETITHDPSADSINASVFFTSGIM